MIRTSSLRISVCVLGSSSARISGRGTMSFAMRIANIEINQSSSRLKRRCYQGAYI
jgi:hypothetical protein